MSTIARRHFLSVAALAAGAGVLTGQTAPAEGPRAEAGFQPYEKIQPQKFPWGWIRWLMNAQLDPAAEMTMGIVRIEPNQSNPLHVHPNSAELLHVLSGSCRHRLGDRWIAMKAGDTLRIPQGVPHMARTADEPCLVMVVYNTGTRQMVPVTEH